VPDFIFIVLVVFLGADPENWLWLLCNTINNW